MKRGTTGIIGTETCPRIGKLFRPCHWEGRWDTQGPADALSASVRAMWSMPIVLADSLQEKSTYVRDVCTTCGTVRERLPASPKPAAGA